MRATETTGELVQVNAELQEANQKLETLSNIDGLTQIANRRMLDGFIGREWPRHLRLQHEFAFKRYNDTYEHVAGDRCLRRVAQAIEEAARRPGDLVARYGGEEFAMVLAETGLEGVHRVVEAIQDGVAALRIPHAGSDLGPYVWGPCSPFLPRAQRSGTLWPPLIEPCILPRPGGATAPSSSGK